MSKQDPNLDADMKLFCEWMSDAVAGSDNLRLVRNPQNVLNTMKETAARKWLTPDLKILGKQ